MKQPRLPGAEKFKFSGQAKDRVCLDDNSVSDKTDGVPESATNFSFIRGHPSYSSCPSSYCTNFQGFTRSDVKRRPLLPISSKKTSRVLNNTSAELNVDNIDVRGDQYALPRVVGGVSRPLLSDMKFARSSARQGLRHTNCDYLSVTGSLSFHQAKLNSHMSDSASTNSGVSQSDCLTSNLSSPRSSRAFPSPESTPSPSTNSSPRSSQISQSSTERCQSPAHILPCTNPPFNWMNHRSSIVTSWRSLSSRSSCASEEDIWVLRKADD